MIVYDTETLSTSTQINSLFIQIIKMTVKGFNAFENNDSAFVKEEVQPVTDCFSQFWGQYYE